MVSGLTGGVHVIRNVQFTASFINHIQMITLMFEHHSLDAHRRCVQRLSQNGYEGLMIRLHSHWAAVDIIMEFYTGKD